MGIHKKIFHLTAIKSVAIKITIIGFAVVIPFLMANPSPSEAIVYFTEEEVLEVAFPNGEKVVAINLEKEINPDERFQVEKKLGAAMTLPYLKCFQGSLDDAVKGYACIDNVRGRYRPITFMIKFDHPGDGIAWYEIMVYREAIGRATRRGPFREQFLGKSFEDAMKYGEDIRMMSGATMSSKGLRRSFRKHQYLYTFLLKKLPVLEAQEEGSVRDMKTLEPVR